MTITETVLVFVIIPLAVVLVVFGFVYGGSAGRAKRYRPGRPFSSAPVWFLAEETPGVIAGASKPELVSSGGDTLHGDAANDDTAHGGTVHGEVGGASDSW